MGSKANKSISYGTFYTNSAQGRFRFVSHVTVLGDVFKDLAYELYKMYHVEILEHI